MDVPIGISVTYSNNAVFLDVTGSIGGRNASQPLPTVTLTRGSTGQAAIQWSAPTNFILESAASLKPGATWQPITNVPVFTNGLFRVTLPVSNSAQFFRLHEK